MPGLLQYFYLGVQKAQMLLIVIFLIDLSSYTLPQLNCLVGPLRNTHNATFMLLSFCWGDELYIGTGHPEIGHPDMSGRRKYIFSISYNLL